MRLARRFFRRRIRPDKVMPFIQIGAHRDVKKSDHHFVVSLIAPSDRRIRIGVV